MKSKTSKFLIAAVIASFVLLMSLVWNQHAEYSENYRGFLTQARKLNSEQIQDKECLEALDIVQTYWRQVKEPLRREAKASDFANAEQAIIAWESAFTESKKSGSPQQNSGTISPAVYELIRKGREHFMKFDEVSAAYESATRL